MTTTWLIGSVVIFFVSFFKLKTNMAGRILGGLGLGIAWPVIAIGVGLIWIAYLLED
jgi:NADH:ubiquinone oxidoreductase subunit K